MQFEVEKLDKFGARINGWDFDRPYDEESKHQLRQLLLEHKMLIFPRRVLAPAELTALSLVFGRALARSSDPRWWHSPEYPQIYKVTNQPSDVHNCACEAWHCDGHYLDDPMGVTIMNQVSAHGANICVADLALAYQSLPPNGQTLLRGIRYYNADSQVVQPLVIKHPATGRIGLYVNMYARPIDPQGKLVPEANELLEKLLKPFEYQHEWQAGDIMVIDNLSVVHKACPGSPENEEVLYRCQTHVSTTWWQPQPVAHAASEPN